MRLQKPKTADKLTHQIAVDLKTPTQEEQAEQAATTPQDTR